MEPFFLSQLLAGDLIPLSVYGLQSIKFTNRKIMPKLFIVFFDVNSKGCVMNESKITLNAKNEHKFSLDLSVTNYEQKSLLSAVFVNLRHYRVFVTSTSDLESFNYHYHQQHYSLLQK